MRARGGGRLIWLPYLEREISEEYLREGKKNLLCYSGVVEFCRSKKGGRPFCVERFLVFFLGKKKEENKV